MIQEPGLSPALKGSGRKRLPKPGRRKSQCKPAFLKGAVTFRRDTAFREGAEKQCSLPSSPAGEESIKDFFTGQAPGTESGMETGGAGNQRGNWKNLAQAGNKPFYHHLPSSLHWSPCFGVNRSQFAQDDLCHVCLA